MATATATNGTVRGGEVLRLGDLTPKTLTIEIEGREQPLKAWLIKSKRFPASVSAELDDARNDYLKGHVRVDPQDQPVSPQLYRAARNLIDHTDSTAVAELQEKGILEGLLGDIKNALNAVESSTVRSTQQGWESYVTRCLMTVCPGLEYHEADLLGPDRMRILVAVGLFSADMLPPEDRPEGAESGDSEQGGEQGEQSDDAGKSPPAPTAPASIGRKRGRASRASTT